jgi:hypothetical protein
MILPVHDVGFILTGPLKPKHIIAHTAKECMCKEGEFKSRPLYRFWLYKHV